MNTEPAPVASPRGATRWPLDGGLRRYWRRQRWLRRAVRTVAALVALAVGALLVAVALTPLPDELSAPVASGLRVLDRHGRLLATLRADGARHEPVTLATIAPDVVPCLLAAEDARFFSHLGVDPLATLRALLQRLTHGRFVSGGSTLTQQLSKQLLHRERSFGGKLREAVLALRIERSLSKQQILEEYLNRVDFGPNVRGLGAASRHYLDKAPADLSLAEAAALLALPRGPSLYDPDRGTERVLRRRNRILERLRGLGLVPVERIDRALAEPLALNRARGDGSAPHLVSALARGELATTELGGRTVAQPTASTAPRAPDAVELTTTLDGQLQRTAATAAARAVETLRASHHVTATAVLVLDNNNGDVLAYVGSHQLADAAGGGHNDGVRARRQPGSTLKPFVYALALEKLGWSPATVLPDLELHLPTGDGEWAPRNYDGRFHGPIRLREALASSLNVPAAFTAHRLGETPLLAFLRALGLRSLDQPASHYGPGLALGVGEVTLLELAQAYATLARGGVTVVPRFLRAARERGGRERRATAPGAGTRVMSASTAALVLSMLSDDAARIATFGPGSPLAFTFPVAAKTGTSKGYRDNWAVGVTRERTVAVWAGNFDGSPMLDSSGITGAAPLFHAVMEAAMRDASHAPLVDEHGLVKERICALGGDRASPLCSDQLDELFTPSTVPHSTASWFERVWVTGDGAERAGPACADRQERTFERPPPRYLSWARSVGRPLAPSTSSPRCPAAESERTGAPLTLSAPLDGATFLLDPTLPAADQELQLAASGAENGEVLRFFVDGRLIGESGPPWRVRYRLKLGAHVAHVESRGRRSEPVRFDVE